jgi:hypothetical protein
MSYRTLHTVIQPFVVSDASVIQSKQPTLSQPTLSHDDTSSNPAVFGPAYWAYLHISTIHLPDNLNPVIAEQIRNVILAIPVTVPCDACSLHSGNFIAQNKTKLMSLKTGKDFFNFTVDLHNFANNRLGKNIVSYDEAREMWK